MASVAIQSLPHVLPLANANECRDTSRPKPSLHVALESLKSQLSAGATIQRPFDDGYASSTQRFSDYKKPRPGAVICVANEEDIIATVKWAAFNQVKFLARGGGHAWATTLSAIGPQDVLIYLRAMNHVNVDLKRGLATVGAGTTTGELTKAASDAGSHIVTTACDTVGAVASILGGGLGNLVSNFGLGSDNILSARLITSTGEVVTASPAENADLFWGIRGAGHNFGIVSELTIKAHPLVNHGHHWTAMLGFPGSKIVAEEVTRTIQEMGITRGQGPAGMSCTAVYGRPMPALEPTVLLKLSFNGPASEALKAFAPVYAIATTTPPSINTSQIVPSCQLNDSKDMICPEGGSLSHSRRPVHSASLKSLDSTTMGILYQRWEEFTATHDDAKESIIRINCYDYRNVANIPSAASAFAWRQNPINILQYWTYTDESLDEEIQQLGEEFRSALTNNQDASVIMNFASGDEKPEAIYGDKLEHMRALKAKWDPSGAFSYYNSVS